MDSLLRTWRNRYCLCDLWDDWYCSRAVRISPVWRDLYERIIWVKKESKINRLQGWKSHTTWICHTKLLCDQYCYQYCAEIHAVISNISLPHPLFHQFVEMNDLSRSIGKWINWKWAEDETQKQIVCRG